MNTLQKAIDERDKFLKARPYLQPLQDKLDDILSKCKPEDRQEVIGLLMGERVTRLRDELQILKELIRNG